MGNWCNARLIVAGRRPDVLRFMQLARKRPSALFRSDMLHGEGGDLFSNPIETLERGIAMKGYGFQIRNDDGRRHFSRISKTFPQLRFILVYFDPNAESTGSFFIYRGRARSYEVSRKLWEAVMARHGITGDLDDEDDASYWEASVEIMDLAESYWQQTLMRAIHR